MYHAPGLENRPDDRPDASLVRLRALGVLSARHGATLALARVSAKPLALLAYCHLIGEGPLDRDVLASLFWPELDQAASRRGLRQAIHALRSAFGQGVVRSVGKHQIVLPGNAVRSDVDAFRILAGSTCHEAAVSLYHGDFMSGARLHRVSGELWDWVEEVRRSLREEAVLSALSVVQDAGQAGSIRKVGTAARRALELAGHDESVLREILSVCHSHRHYDLAMELYAGHCLWLDHQGGMDPTPATRRFFADLFLAAAG